MTIDARIPLMVQPVKSELDRQQSLADLAYKNQQIAASQAKIDRDGKLAELLPQAMGGDQGALGQVAGVDPDMYFKIKTQMGNMDKATREREAGKWTAAAPLLARMKTIPYEQRRSFLQQAAPSLVAQGWTQEELAQFDPTDESVDALGTAAMTVAQVLDSQKISWHPIGENGAFATDNLGNPTGTNNPFAQGGGGGDMPTISSPDQARTLPPGTQFKTPDGRIMRVPGGGAGNSVGGF